MIRIWLPAHLRTLAKVSQEVELEVPAAGDLASALTALEEKYPVLRGTIRDHVTFRRRPFIRFFACEEDLSNESMQTRLPDAVLAGKEPLLIIGAMAGG